MNISDVLLINVDKHTIEGKMPDNLFNYVVVYKNERITSDIDFMESSADERDIKKFQIKYWDVLSTKDSKLVDEDLPGVLCGYHLAPSLLTASR